MTKEAISLINTVKELEDDGDYEIDATNNYKILGIVFTDHEIQEKNDSSC